MPTLGFASLPEAGHQKLKPIRTRGDIGQFGQELILTPISIGPASDPILVGLHAASKADERERGASIFSEEEIDRFPAGVSGVADQQHRHSDLKPNPEHVLHPVGFLEEDIGMEAGGQGSGNGVLIRAAQIDDAKSLALGHIPQKVFHGERSFHGCHKSRIMNIMLNFLGSHSK